MPVPNIYEDTTPTHGTGALSVPWGTHNDTFYAILVVTCAGDGTLGAPTQSGADGTWVFIGSCAEGAGAGSIQIGAWYCKATSGSMSNITVPDTGDHTSAKLFMLQNVVQSGNPINKVTTQTVSSATATISVPTFTTTVQNCLVFCLAGCAFDQATNPGGSGWSNASLDSGASFGGQYCTDNGTGGGYMGGIGEKATAGACGTFSHTWASGATKQANITFAISDTASPSNFSIDAESGSVAITGTAATLRSPLDKVISADAANLPITGYQVSFFNGGNAPQVRGRTAPAAGLSTTSPSSTEVGDMVLCWTWERNGAGSAAHTLQSTFTEVRTHEHNDGSTDGRLSCAYKIATTAGAQSYQPYTSSDGTATWTGCVVIKRKTYGELSAIASNSVTSTTNAVPDPNSVTLSATRNYLVFAVAAWHHGSSASITPGAPTNYGNLIEVAGSANGELAITNRTITSGATSEDPGAFTDNVAPNGTCSMTVAIPNAVWFVNASPAEVAIAGTDATLTHTITVNTLSAESGNVPITGMDAALRAKELAAESANIGITGTDAGLYYGRKVAAESGSIPITGTDADFLRGTGVDAESASVPIAGTDAGVLATRVMTAEAGAVAITGTDASLEDGPLVIAEAGGVAITGTDADLRAVRTMTAEAGAVPITGTDASLEDGPVVAAEAGAVAITGTDADLRATRAITAEAGSVPVTGTNVDLRAALIADAQAGAVPITGVAAALALGAKIVAESADVPITGAVADLLLGRLLTGEAGGVSITGTDADLDYQSGATLDAESTNVPVTGTDASLEYGPEVEAESANIPITGTNVDLRQGRTLDGEATNVPVTGTNADLRAARAMTAESGAVAITGTDASLEGGPLVSAESASVAITGVDAGLTVSRRLSAELGLLPIIGIDADLVYSGIQVIILGDGGATVVQGTSPYVTVGQPGPTHGTGIRQADNRLKPRIV